MSERTASAIVDTAPDAIIGVDGGQTIVEFNAAAARLFGISRAEALGQPLERFIPSRSRQDRAVRMQEDTPTDDTRRSHWYPPTVTAVKADGTEFPVEASFSRASRDGTTLFSVFVRDATQRRQFDTQLQRARTMDAVAQLAAGVAHDFNNLLMVILGNLELMDMSHGDEALVKDFGREARSAAERGTALARQLLAFSRRSPLPRQPADVNAVIAKNEDALRRAAGPRCSLEIVVGDAPLVVEGNAPQLDQLLVNLVSNARDAMGDGGLISIQVDRVDLGGLDGARWPTLATGPYVRLRVSDTGAGMSEEAQRRAFEPFFTTKPAGHATGLGLAAVFGIAAQLGGAVDAENNPDAGSTFTVLLPQSDKPAAEGAAFGAAARQRGHGVILLVDDEKAVRATILMILTKNGYSVIEAANGRDALDAYHENHGRIDLVLTDLRMPEIDGRSLAALLHAERPTLPVLLMTGYDDSADVAASPGEGAELLLPKPFTAPALLDAIAERLAGAK